MTPQALLEALSDAPGYGQSWWAPRQNTFICRHFGADDAEVELETDSRRERATRVFLSLGKLP